VPRPIKQSEMDALPEPELNPVLNPLLAAHMGRWAEVYFTTLPEKRGQAVSQLLRELQSGSFSEPASLRVIDDEKSEKQVETEEALDAPPQVAGTVPISAARWSEPEPSLDGHLPQYAIGESRPAAVRGGRDDLEAAWVLPGRSLPHLDAEYGAESDVKPQPVPSRYRIYVSVTLAILILLAFLLYMAWRGTKSNPRVAGTQSTLSTTAQEANPPDSPVQSRNKITATSRERRPAGALAASRAVTTAKSHSVIGVEQSGVDEFVTAQRYLKGTPGTTPDSREAARWLWKAVSKKSPAAMIALSDLYLRGDGVPKSCDQARLLLDAAARKGVTAAAERLRHLQAFGCE
jgi:hypothetical protein